MAFKNLICFVAGRSETEVEYDVGFDSDGIISALECKTLLIDMTGSVQFSWVCCRAV